MKHKKVIRSRGTTICAISRKNGPLNIDVCPKGRFPGDEAHLSALCIQASSFEEIKARKHQNPKHTA